MQQLLLENGFADRHEKKAVKGLNEHVLKVLYGIYECYSLLLCFVWFF